MSDSDTSTTNAEDPLGSDDLPQHPQLSSHEDDEEEEGEDEEEEEMFVPDFNGTSESSESDASSADSEGPPRKKIKANVPKKSTKSYQWVNPQTETLNETPSESCGTSVKEEFISLDPLEIFYQFFDEPFIRLIVKLTNNNASQDGKSLKLTESELTAYFGMLIIMGFHKLPHFCNYWQYDQNLKVPRIAEVMSLNRFKDIARYLSFSPEANVYRKGEEQRTNLRLVRPLLDHLNEKFCQIRHPRKPMSIDQSTVRPRNLEEQFRQSRERYFSVMGLCCAKTGYMFRVSVHSSEKDGLFSSDNCIRDLLLPFEGRGYSIYVPQKYCSFILAEELSERQILSCCELKRNDPNIPLDVRNKRLKSGSRYFEECGSFSITKWKDFRRHCVYILSTFHNPRNMSSITTDKEVKDYPQVVLDYCKYKRGVRIFDRERLTYSTSWKCFDWRKRVFYYMLDATIVNSLLVYKSSWDSMKPDESGNPLSCVEFRSKLANGLIGGFGSRKREYFKPALQRFKKNNAKGGMGLSSATKISSHLQDVGSKIHLPIKSTCRRCANCTLKGKRRRSMVACTACNVALCISCFAPFHTAEETNDNDDD